MGLVARTTTLSVFRTGSEESAFESLRRQCVFESSVSIELVMRLQMYPKMRAALSVLPPKLLELNMSGPPQQPLPPSESDGQHVARAMESILHATFTGKGDKVTTAPQGLSSGLRRACLTLLIFIVCPDVWRGVCAGGGGALVRGLCPAHCTCPAEHAGLQCER
jgi:hypothetical protein